MINVLALGLLVSSLAAAGVWSPLPDPSSGDRAVVREGHRVIVVEYERRDLPSQTPSPPPPHSSTQKLLDEAKDKFHEAASHLPNLGQGISTTPEAAAGNSDVEPAHYSAKEVICDAYGSCKEKLSNLFSKSKEEVTDKASRVVEEGKDKISHEASRAKEKAESAVRDVVGNLSSAAEETAGAVRRGLSETVLRRAKDVVGDAIRARETAGSVAHLLGFAVAYGTGFWVTFVSSHVLATALPRQQFGVVQSKMYPVYFRAMAYGVGLAAAAEWLGRRGMAKERAQGYNLVAALGLVLVNMLYLEPKATKVMFERMKMEKEEGRGRDMADVIVEPVMTTASTATTATATPTTTTTHATRTTTYSVRAATSDQEEAIKGRAIKGRAVKLNKRLKQLNTYSSVLNVLSLMGLTWHLVHLAGRMQLTC